MKKRLFAGMVLVLLVCGNAHAMEWRIDWGTVGNYFGGLFRKDTPEPPKEVLPESIASDWGTLTETLTDTLTLRDKQETLPGWTWVPFAEDKASYAEKINALLDKALGILSKGDANKTRQTATELKEKAAKMRVELDGLRNKKITAPEKSYNPFKLTKTKADERIAELEERIADAEDKLAAINGELADALREIGLELDASQAEVLLNSVTGDDLLQNAVVFSNVKGVVMKLEELAQNDTNTLDITRRYTGMYLVLNDLLIATQEELIRKIDGEYKPQINDITREAETLRKDAMTKSVQNAYTPQQRAAFARNAESNARTVQVARLYTELLNSQRAGTMESLKSLRLNRDLAENTYRTVRSSGELRGLIHSGLSAFDAVSALEMPELKVFESGAMREEFDEINRRLKK